MSGSAPNLSSSTVKMPEKDVNLLKREGYVVGSLIGEGGFSMVCTATKGTTKMAVKIIDLDKCDKDIAKKFVPRELYSLSKLKHPNIIEIYAIHTILPRVYVFMELAEGGDVVDLVSKELIAESRVKSLYKGVAEALKYIHGLGSAHRDIKSENILLNKSKSVAKIADFGFARRCFDASTGQRMLSTTHCGTPIYVAPEVLQGGAYDAMISDVYSMGVVLFFMLNSKLPFDEKNLPKLLKIQLNSNYTFNNKSNISVNCKDLIKKLLEPDPKKRITIAKALEHNWFK